MGAQSDRLRCEVCQNLILSPINTGFLRYAVATVLTVYGIETNRKRNYSGSRNRSVATVLTVYGIETRPWIDVSDLIPTVATVLTVYGIETYKRMFLFCSRYS